ncbi:hypothetical protein HHA04nite_15800 [Halomonas halophila]|uniref:Uncharacterized protein n=1 Tax=Halomonas halophila TaxID=29573 RepID=A0ABQ0U3C2_9GAMM|nr:hypothetical protein HHA04nite_15800 [Halomonas halophila]
MAVAHQAACDVAAHSAESDDTELHVASFDVIRDGVRDGGKAYPLRRRDAKRAMSPDMARRA